MPTTSQLVPPCNPRHAYGLRRVRELSLRLEPVSHDTFRGLVGRSTSASRVASLTNDPRRAPS
jgi:hypothetical protein